MTLDVDEKQAAPPSTIQSQDKNHTQLEAAQQFFDDLYKVPSRDKARMALLRRNAGETLDTSRNVNWIYGALSRHCHNKYKENTYFIVACLYAYDKDMHGKVGHLSKNLGKTMKELKATSNISDDSLERRFRIMLDAEFDKNGGGELAFRLRQIVQYILRHSGKIDWPQLLIDLYEWDNPNRRVQKAWAKSFYGDEQSNSSTEITQN